ncbi:hypothetical protein [Natrinema halophilum]|uniref:Uncharacterized protein n=1 Tax=Natrinema halophilum TaxID=1699371 RepID=A0A7D5GQM7_9EURY|nr:hypothetical protein [Natrinema halophilum]QLG47869.1 hypothetical protein HYG82_02920 [Natrinema halophilum]
MTTQVMTLEEYADMIGELAADWDGDQPAVLIGDVTGNVSVNAKEGYSKYGPVGYAQECFEGNGVFELGQHGDRRFFGTMLFAAEDLAEEARAQLEADKEVTA